MSLSDLPYAGKVEAEEEEIDPSITKMAEIRNNVLGYAALHLVDDGSEGDIEQMSQTLARIVALSHELCVEREAAMAEQSKEELRKRTQSAFQD